MAYGEDDALLGGNNKWVNALALLGATMQDISAAQQGRQGGALLGARQMLAAQKKQAEEASQKSAQAALLGGLDPTTGITWNQPRQGASETDQKALFMRAFPEAGAKAAAASLFPKPMDPKDRYMAVGDSLVDLTKPGAGPVYQAPSPFLFPGAPGMSSAGGGTGGTTTSVQPASPSGGADPATFAPDLDMKVGMMEEKYGLPAGAFRSLVQAESGGRPGVVSPKGAMGYTQLMPGTAKDLGVDPSNPDQNLEGGARYLKQQLDKYGNLDHALVAYNWGPGNADMWIKSGADPARLPAETRAYLGKITGGGGGRVQVAQASTGTMTDAGPAGAPAPAGQWVRGIDRKTGKHLDIEQNTATGEIRSVGGGSMFSGNSVEGQALNQLVESGVLTKEQALTWAAGKTATGPNGQLDFITPQAMRPGAAPAAGGAAPPAITPVRQGQLAPQDKDAIMEADKAAEAAAGAVNSLNDALKLNRQAWGGAMAPIMQGADRMLPGEWGGAATTELENIIGTQALGQLKAIFGAAPTEGERKILMDLQGSITKSADEREVIFKRAIEAAQNRLQREQGRAKALRGGTYYTEGMPQQATQPSQQGGGRVLRFDAQGNMIP